MIFPPTLRPDDLIAITCPAGAVEPFEHEGARSFLMYQGYEVHVGKTVGSSYHRFAATDEHRLIELQSLLDNPTVGAILCGRGGYGTMRIVEQLDLSAFIQHPKWLIGFSDITCLHSFIQKETQVVTLHGHMLKGFQPPHYDPVSTQYMMDLLRGERPEYVWQSAHAQEVSASGRLVGGNLALLSDLVGTIADIDTEGTILFVEEVSEYYYNIDRMMMQLRLAGKLSGLSGLLLGAFTDTQDNEVPFGESVYEIMQRVTKDYGIPIFSGLPAGHQDRNWPLLLGADYTVSQRGTEVSLRLSGSSA